MSFKFSHLLIGTFSKYKEQNKLIVLIEVAVLQCKIVCSLQRIHFPAPRFTTNDAKKQPRRLTNSANHEPPDSTPKPFTLMQIAEKYRKELRDYNDGTLNLPSDKENRLPAEKGRLEQEAQAPDQKVPSSKGEAVEESTTLIGAEKEGLERTNSKSAETNGDHLRLLGQ